ncbi:MAG: DUF4065 domain-containing protein [Lactobacillus iners]|nr:DUF4065 domain-containing protein [Lactobacillus iners]
MKLQKLAYYSQAYSLATTGYPLFNEDFQAWRNGSVCPELFASHRGKFLIRKGELVLPSTDKLNDNSLTDGQKILVEKICKKFAECSDSDLSAMTHREDSWKDAYDGTNSSAICVQKITKDSLKEYYSVHNLLK